MVGASDSERRARERRLILVVAGVIVAVAGIIASLTDLGATTDVTINERVADDQPPGSPPAPSTVSTTVASTTVASTTVSSTAPTSPAPPGGR